MEKRYFQLEAKENSRFVRIVQIIFGILCTLIALYWVIFQFASLRADTSLWITIVFLAGFGTYQIAAGFGRIKRYIEIEQDRIMLKQNSFLPAINLKPSVIEKIELFPVSVWFIMEKKKRIILRFGMSYTDIIEPVKNALTKFASLNNIAVEVRKEEI